MRTLGLFRHAKSDYPSGVDDHDRPLSGRGERNARAFGDVVRSRMGTPDLVLVSSARRAQQTWELAAAAWTTLPRQVDEPRIYEASPDALFEVLQDVDTTAESLLLVGHNPGLAYLALSLASPTSQPEPLERLRDKYPTCALACFDIAGTWADLAPGGAALQSFDTPR
jgi:phosphohistidine phosphatase